MCILMYILIEVSVFVHIDFLLLYANILTVLYLTLDFRSADA